jgi:hypothetical protein
MGEKNRRVNQSHVREKCSGAMSAGRSTARNGIEVTEHGASPKSGAAGNVAGSRRKTRDGEFLGGKAQ